MQVSTTTNATIGVGFGTAALGGNSFQVVTTALEAGFRKFDTAEADWWYDQANVGRALESFVLAQNGNNKCADLEISTKIPPWSLTEVADVRTQAETSRLELVGFCPDYTIYDQDEMGTETSIPFPLDVYYIHAPKCWRGWHPRCDDPPPIMNLRSSWMAMEYVVHDKTAKRIGLSNVHPNELLDIIQFVEERKKSGETDPPPRIPDVLQAYADPLQSAEGLRQICAEHGIEFVSYSTLGTQHRNVDQNPVLTHPTVIRLAEKYSRSVAEVVLSWALQSDMSVIPRSTKKEHILELAKLLPNKPFLSEEDAQAISDMGNEASSEL